MRERERERASCKPCVPNERSITTTRIPIKLVVRFQVTSSNADMTHMNLQKIEV